MRDQKELRITRDGLFLEDIKRPLSTKELSDSMVHFCEERHHWKIVADADARAMDFKPVLEAALVRQPCKGLLHLKTEHSESWVMPLIPISRNYYSLDEADTSKPVLCMTAYAHPFGLGLTLMSGMLAPINTVHTKEGKEYVRDDTKPNKVALAWQDKDGRCLVAFRKALCVDSLEADRKYQRMGRLDMLIDTIRGDSLPKDVTLKPLTLEMSLRAQFHVLRGIRGALSRSNYYHLMADSTMSANMLFDRISAFRRINIDFNTFELH
jgi:hypothetical protein